MISYLNNIILGDGIYGLEDGFRSLVGCSAQSLGPDLLYQALRAFYGHQIICFHLVPMQNIKKKTVEKMKMCLRMKDNKFLSLSSLCSGDVCLRYTSL